MKFKNREEYDKNKLYFTLVNCPFCTKMDKSKIIFESEYWFVIYSDYPYFIKDIHLMAIPKRHVEFTYNLMKEEFADFCEIENFMKNFYKNKGEYFSFIRQSKGNKSVEHLHYHYLLGSPGAKIINGEKFFRIKD